MKRPLAKKKRKKQRDVLDLIKKLPCTCCGRKETDPAHIKSKGAGGDDSYENVIPLCRPCHQIQHKIGVASMFLGNRKYRFALSVRGWDVIEEFGRYKLVRK